jgi:hypothetical protein
MKLRNLLWLLVLITPALWGQLGNSGVVPVGTAPSGSCTPQPGQLVVGTGQIYTCQSATWALYGGGGGGTTPGGSNFAIQYNNNGAFGGSSTITTDANGDLLVANLGGETYYPSSCGTLNPPLWCQVSVTSITSVSGTVSGTGVLYLNPSNNNCNFAQIVVNYVGGVFQVATQASGAIIASGYGCTAPPTTANCTSGSVACPASSVTITSTIGAAMPYYTQSSSGNTGIGDVGAWVDAAEAQVHSLGPNTGAKVDWSNLGQASQSTIVPGQPVWLTPVFSGYHATSNTQGNWIDNVLPLGAWIYYGPNIGSENNGCLVQALAFGTMRTDSAGEDLGFLFADSGSGGTSTNVLCTDPSPVYGYLKLQGFGAKSGNTAKNTGPTLQIQQLQDHSVVQNVQGLSHLQGGTASYFTQINDGATLMHVGGDTYGTGIPCSFNGFMAAAYVGADNCVHAQPGSPQKLIATGSNNPWPQLHLNTYDEGPIGAPTSISYVSGGTPTGTGTATLTLFNGSCNSSGTAIMGVTSGVPGAITPNNVQGCSSLPTSATCGAPFTGTAFCSGSVTLTSTWDTTTPDAKLTSSTASNPGAVIINHDLAEDVPGTTRYALENDANSNLIALGVTNSHGTNLINDLANSQQVTCVSSPCTVGLYSTWPVWAKTIVDFGLTAGTSPICPNGTNGAFTTSGCNIGGQYYQTVQNNGTAQIQEPALNLIPGTDITISCADNSGVSTGCTINASGSVATNWSAVTGSQTNTGTGFVLSGAGAASTPAWQLTGAPYAGTNANSFGQLDLTSGSAASITTLNTAGTYFTIRAPSGSASDLANFYNNTTSEFKVTSNGSTTVNGILTTNGGLVSNATGSNWFNQNATGFSAVTASTFQFAGSSGVNFRAAIGGTSTSVTATAGDNVTGLLVTSPAFSTPATGTNSWVTNTAIAPLGTITSGGAAVTNTATLYVSANGASIGSNNYGLYNAGTLYSAGAATLATSLALNGSQALTSVQGTAGTKLPAASGTFTNGNLRSTNSTGDEIDSGVAATSLTVRSGTVAITANATALTCTTGTASISGATTSMTAVASAAGTADLDTSAPQAYVSAAGTVTVQVCTLIADAAAPSITYNIRVIP